MNDTPITDFDKLKNTLIEIGVDFDIDEYWTEFTIIGRVKFIFRCDGQLKDIEILDESPSDD